METEKNLPTRTSMPVTVMTTEIVKILGTIIFRTRLAKGWNGYDPKTQDMAIQTWFEILQTEKIPPEFFDELYRRACNFQAFQIQNGKDAPDMSAQLMLSQWIGGNGLRSELREREIAAKNRLPETAASKCPRCLGINMEIVFDGDGKKLGSRPNCRHDKLKPGEWLWKQADKEFENAG